jgi:hypothetical protein
MIRTLQWNQCSWLARRDLRDKCRTSISHAVLMRETAAVFDAPEGYMNRAGTAAHESYCGYRHYHWCNLARSLPYTLLLLAGAILEGVQVWSCGLLALSLPALLACTVVQGLRILLLHYDATLLCPEFTACGNSSQIQVY